MLSAWLTLCPVEILNANPVSSELLSKPLEDIIGMHYSEFHPPGIRERAQESFKAHVEDRGPGQPIETALLTADGKEVPVELLAQIIQVDGVPVLMGTFRDITQRKELRGGAPAQRRTLPPSRPEFLGYYRPFRRGRHDPIRQSRNRTNPRIPA